MRVELLLTLAFEILTFNATVASGADAAIKLVVMMLTVWGVINYVEGRRLEGLAASLAPEALLVITSRQASICRRHRAPLDWVAAAFAVPFCCCRTAQGFVLGCFT
jgi:hypothetical protein